MARENVVCGVRDSVVTCVDYYGLSDEEAPLVVSLPTAGTNLSFLPLIYFVGLVCQVETSGSVTCQQASEDYPDMSVAFEGQQVTDLSAGSGLCALTSDSRLICAYNWRENPDYCPYCDEVAYF